MRPKRSIIPIFIPHLGCRHQCVFCNQRRIAGQAEPPGADQVKRIIKNGLEILPPDTSVQAAFYGGSFTAIDKKITEQLLGAAKPFLDAGRLDSLRISTRPDAINGEILRELREAGVRVIELGAQSMDDTVLRRCRRGHTAADTQDAAQRVKTAGFTLILQMMCGLPGQSEQSALDTARSLAELAPDGVRIYPAVVLKDTALERLWREGAYRPMSVERAACLGAELIEVFEDRGIPVIRFGLNPTQELSGGTALAGAYHPALGEMAHSALYLRRARALLAAQPHGGRVCLGVHPSCVSFMVGHKGQNRRLLKREFALETLKITPADVEKGRIMIC